MRLDVAPLDVNLLKKLDLAGVAITAAILPDGTLLPVGGTFAKLLAAARDRAFPRIHTVIVAKDQDLTGLGLAEHPPGSRRFRDPLDDLYVLPAETLAEAVELLAVEALPRRAVRTYERKQCGEMDILGRRAPIEVHYRLLSQLVGPAGTSQARHTPDDVIFRWGDAEDSALRGAVPRFMVRGLPGSGKSTLIQYLAWRIADDSLPLPYRSLVPACVGLREWETWALGPRGNTSLSAYLHEQCRHLEHAPTVEHWETWLRRGTVLLLLDGLDEISGDKIFVSAVRAALTAYATTPTVVTCRTDAFGAGRLGIELPIYELRGLDVQEQDGYISHFPAENRDYDPTEVIRQLNRASELRSLVANPLLLTVVCFIADSAERIDLPQTKDDLLEKAVEKLLSRPIERPVVYPAGTEVQMVHKMRALKEAARALTQRCRPPFSQGHLIDALEKGVKLEPKANVAACLFSDLLKRGILRGNQDKGYSFLHPEFQDFLARPEFQDILVTDPPPGRPPRLGKVLILAAAVIALVGWWLLSPRVVGPPPQEFADKLWRLDWVAYEPPTEYVPGRQYPPREVIRDDLKILHEWGFSGLITFGSEKTLAEIPRLAREVGFDGVIMGIEVPELPAAGTGPALADMAMKAAKESIDAAVGASDQVDAYALGHNAYHALGRLAEEVQTLRRRTGKPVTTTLYLEDYGKIAEQVNFLFPDLKVCWRGGKQTPEGEFKCVKEKLKQAEALGNRFKKPVLLKVVSFPSSGNGYTENAQAEFYRRALYYYRIEPEDLKLEVGISFFLAFDVFWKTQAGGEKHSGIFRQDRTPKPAACEFVRISRDYRGGFAVAPSARVKEQCGQAPE